MKKLYALAVGLLVSISLNAMLPTKPSTTTAQSQPTTITDLPNDVIINIASLLPTHDIHRMQHVDRRFRQLINTDPELSTKLNVGCQCYSSFCPIKYRQLIIRIMESLKKLDQILGIQDFSSFDIDEIKKVIVKNSTLFLKKNILDAPLYSYCIIHPFVERCKSLQQMIKQSQPDLYREKIDHLYISTYAPMATRIKLRYGFSITPEEQRMLCGMFFNKQHKNFMKQQLQIEKSNSPFLQENLLRLKRIRDYCHGLNEIKQILDWGMNKIEQEIGKKEVAQINICSQYAQWVWGAVAYPFSRSITTFNNLPPSVIAHIASLIRKHDVRNLRLVNKRSALSIPAAQAKGPCNCIICYLGLDKEE